MSTETKNHTVAYDRYCAFAVSTGKTKVKAGKHSLTMEGKIYLFSNPIAKLLFKLLPNRIEKANINWKNK